MRHKNKWKHGDRSKIAKASGITRSYLTYILQGKKTPRPQVAEAISAIALRHGYRISTDDLFFPSRSKNPLLQ
jgi:transcriptional regulator with XRE-family HTH domain